MTALALTAAVLAANPYANAFWAKDLGRLHAELLKPGAPHRGLFVDLLRVSTCQEPGPLEGDEDRALREALRLELARQPAQAFDDIRNAAFFSRAPWTPAADGKALAWTVEDERWPDEADVPAPLPQTCSLPAPREVAVPEDFLQRLAQVSPKLSARWTYLAAVQHYRAGDTEGAQKLARALDPAATGGLRGWALGLRALLVQLPADAAQVAQLPEPVRVPISERACYWAVEEGDLPRALQFASAASSETLTLCRTAALARSGDVASAVAQLEALPAGALGDARRDWVRALSLVTGDVSLLDGATKDLEPRPAAQWLTSLAQAALERGKTALARHIAIHLRDTGAELSAETLEGELLFRDARLPELEPRLASLLDEDGVRFKRRLQRTERDRALASLLRRLVLADAETGGTHRAMLRDLHERFSFVATGAARSELQAVTALLESEDDSSGVRRRALGVLTVPSWPNLPKPERADLAWPVPGPLFGIPTEDGGLRTWFGADAEEVGGGN